MTMLWLSGSGEMTVVRSHRNERMFYACNPNVTVTRAPSLRIQVLQVRHRHPGAQPAHTGAPGTSPSPGRPACAYRCSRYGRRGVRDVQVLEVS